jgi:hypothetical protein
MNKDLALSHASQTVEAGKSARGKQARRKLSIKGSGFGDALAALTARRTGAPATPAAVAPKTVKAPFPAPLSSPAKPAAEPAATPGKMPVRIDRPTAAAATGVPQAPAPAPSFLGQAPPASADVPVRKGSRTDGARSSRETGAPTRTSGRPPAEGPATARKRRHAAPSDNPADALLAQAAAASALPASKPADPRPAADAETSLPVGAKATTRSSAAQAAARSAAPQAAVRPAPARETPRTAAVKADPPQAVHSRGRDADPPAAPGPETGRTGVSGQAAEPGSGARTHANTTVGPVAGQSAGMSEAPAPPAGSTAPEARPRFESVLRPSTSAPKPFETPLPPTDGDEPPAVAQPASGPPAAVKRSAAPPTPPDAAAAKPADRPAGDAAPVASAPPAPPPAAAPLPSFASRAAEKGDAPKAAEAAGAANHREAAPPALAPTTVPGHATGREAVIPAGGGSGTGTNGGDASKDEHGEFPSRAGDATLLAGAATGSRRAVDAAAAGTPEEAPKTAPPDAPPVHEQLRFRLSGLPDGTHEVEIRLSPETLGDLKIDLRIHGGSMDAAVRAATPEAREALLREAPALREALASGGITLNSFDVSLSGGQNFGDTPASRAGRWDGPGGRREHGGGGGQEAAAGNLRADRIAPDSLAGAAGHWIA